MNTLYFNGTILTMQGETPNQVQAVLVENGRIQAVGTIEEMKERITDKTQKIDLLKKTMLPSFIDAHSHITALAQTLSVVDLSKCTTFEQIINTIKEYQVQEQIPEGNWMIGFGYDHNFLKEKKHPSKLELDEASMKHPILIGHTSGHMGVTNSLGLKKMGIDETTKNPEGGTYGRMPKTQEPNGYLEENAFMNVSKMTGGFSISQLEKLVEKAQQIYLENGITTVQDGLLKKREFEVLRQLAKHEKLVVDVVGYVAIKENKEILQENKEYVNQYQNRFKLGGYKLLLDGSPQGKTAWMTKPYEDEQEYRGYPTHTTDEVQNYVDMAVQEKQQLLTHCNGDAAADQLLNAFSKQDSKNTKAIRPIMIHAQTVRKDQISKMKQIGMIPSYFIAHTYYWGDIHLKNLGTRAQHISPANTTQKEQLMYTFHQDSPVIAPNMLETIWCAVNRVTKSGITLGEDETIEVYDALKAVTINAAYQYFEEYEKGSIEIGKLADFVILDKNPLTVPKEELNTIQVVETIKEGKTLFRTDKEKDI